MQDFAVKSAFSWEDLLDEVGFDGIALPTLEEFGAFCIELCVEKVAFEPVPATDEVVSQSEDAAIPPEA